MSVQAVPPALGESGRSSRPTTAPPAALALPAAGPGRVLSLGSLIPPWARALCSKCGSLWERPGQANADRFATACCSGPAALRLAQEMETEALSQRLVAARDAWVARRCASCRPVYDPFASVSAAGRRLAEDCPCLRIEDGLLAAEQQRKQEDYTRARRAYLSGELRIHPDVVSAA